MADTEVQGGPAAEWAKIGGQVAAIHRRQWEAMLATMRQMGEAIEEALRQAAADVRPPAEDREAPRRPRRSRCSCCSGPVCISAPPDRVNVDALSPIQYLILDVLAARHRLGGRVWRFPARFRPALRALDEAEGLVGWKAGIEHGTVLAWLTDAGRAAVLDDRYEQPAPMATRYPGDGQTPVELTMLWSVRLPGSRFPVGTTRDEAKARQVLAEWRAERQEAGATGPEPELIRRLVSEWVPADAPTSEADHTATGQDTQP